MATQKESQTSKAAVGNFCSKVQRYVDQCVCDNRLLSMVQELRCIGVYVSLRRFVNSIDIAADAKSMVRQNKCECHVSLTRILILHGSFEEKKLPLVQRYGTKAAVWLGCFSFIGNYWYDPCLCYMSTLCIAIGSC